MRESSTPKSTSSKQLLEENEARFQLLLNSVKDYAIFMLDPQGYITTWNTGAERIKGYSREEILHQHFSIFYPQEALERNHPSYELEVAASEGSFEEEGWRLKKDGTMFWASVVISAVYNNRNELVGFSKVTRDLTERRNLELNLLKANEELQQSEERSRLVIDGVKDYAIFLLSPQGTISSWNEGAKRIKGYEAEEIVGQHFSTFYIPESAAAQFPQFELRKALEHGKFEDEGWRVRKNGTKFWANVLIYPIFNANKEHIGFTKITRDLSERVRNEDLTKKNVELHKLNTDLDNFIYTASHDLKSPIANMEGLLSLIEKKVSPQLNEEGKQMMGMLETSVRQLNSTIKSLIEVTKAQKNLEDKVETVQLEAILEEVKGEIADKIEEAGAEIRQDLKVQEISFPKVSLKSIIYNLLSNAIKYRSPERKAVIIISTFTEGKHTILSMKDNGLGLNETQQARLFSMFKRFHNHVEGTGIGLYIVKRTMENNNGKISVQSKLNEGTEFKLYFRS
ncbi:sensor histidine kinase [Nafulsella turpanensis]|uniref:sensor histidine kinase n=1 Tax=Nafulsella turpanensis TaxID=1265690 RepID=UPI00037C9DC5|nr:PAS domain-containing sensor histidine kinase [Nafulsella turpanensis]